MSEATGSVPRQPSEDARSADGHMVGAPGPTLRVGGQVFSWNLDRLVPAVLAVALLVLPLFLSDYMQTIATAILVFAMFAASLDILWGYTGLFSLGHAAFLGAGGYTAALLMVRYGIDSFWIGVLLGVVVAALMGAVFGYIALRLAGTYFLLVTLALGQLVAALGIRWQFLSTQSGVAGVYGLVLPNLGLPFLTLSDNRAYYWLVCIAFIGCFAILHRFVRTPVGAVLQGIRQNEPRMRALGYNTWAYQYFAFIAAAAFAGFAGVLLAYQQGFVTPKNVDIDTSTIVLIMVLVGGPGTLYGSVIGAALIMLLQLVASSFLPERWPMILGASYVAAVILARRGLFAWLSEPYARLKQRVLASRRAGSNP